MGKKCEKESNVIKGRKMGQTLMIERKYAVLMWVGECQVGEQVLSYIGGNINR